MHFQNIEPQGKNDKRTIIVNKDYLGVPKYDKDKKQKRAQLEKY